MIRGRRTQTMPQDEKYPTKLESLSPSLSHNSTRHGQQSWFTTPAPIKHLFNRFPLRTYSANELPLRNPPHRIINNLYIFTDGNSAKLGLPSFNPGCLKWQVSKQISGYTVGLLLCWPTHVLQAYLKFLGIQFSTVPSNNHASPTGALPFLIPSSLMLPAHESSPPIASTNLERWAQEEHSRKVVKKLLLHDQTQRAEKKKLAGQNGLDMRHEAYMSLLDCRIRNAWVSISFGPKLTHFC